MKLPLIYYGHPLLRKKALRIEGITDELRQFIADMEETRIADNGLGLAAPQVNRSIALFIINAPIQKGPKEWVDGVTKIFINPKILAYSEEQRFYAEGCLSIPGLYAEVCRPATVKVEYTNLEGVTLVEEFTDWEARIIMHENDHLNGVLFIDRIQGRERVEMESKLRELKKKFLKSK